MSRVLKMTDAQRELFDSLDRELNMSPHADDNYAFLMTLVSRIREVVEIRGWDFDLYKKYVFDVSEPEVV